MPSLSFFLRTGIGCKQSKAAEGIALWTDISELWFLCLSALADCAALSPTPQSLLLPDVLSLLTSAPAGTFSAEDQQYLQSFQTKVSLVVKQLQEKRAS